MASELDGVADEKADGGPLEVRSLLRLDDEGACEISPAVGGTKNENNSGQSSFSRSLTRFGRVRSRGHINLQDHGAS